MMKAALRFRIFDILSSLRVMQSFLSILHASSGWVNEHLGWFLTNGNKQFRLLDSKSEVSLSEPSID
jgi:hypothetical protein